MAEDKPSTTQWAAIPIAPNYEVSTHGQIRRASTGKIMKLRLDDGGYMTICVRVCGIHKLLRVNRMVLLAFAGAPPNDNMQAAHLDGSRTNNLYSNLMWATVKENASHRAIHGTGARGQCHGLAKLTDAQALSILQRVRIANRAIGDRGNVKQLAQEFNVSLDTVGLIYRRAKWKHLDQ